MLYKDPKGETVFSDVKEEAVQIASILGGASSLGENEVDGLKEKIKNLEDVLTEYKVCISWHITLHLWLHDCHESSTVISIDQVIIAPFNFFL